MTPLERAQAIIAELEGQRNSLGTRAAQMAGDIAALKAENGQLTAANRMLNAKLAGASKPNLEITPEEQPVKAEG